MFARFLRVDGMVASLFDWLWLSFFIASCDKLFLERIVWEFNRPLLSKQVSIRADSKQAHFHCISDNISGAAVKENGSQTGSLSG